MLKLSPTQKKVLVELSKPNSVLHYMPYMGRFREDPYWFVSGSMRHVRCSTVERLEKLGLVKVTGREGFNSTKAIITDKGRAQVSDG